MKDLLEQAERSICAHGLFRRGQKILVAVSGGVDSMVLLHVLQQLSKKDDWLLAVAHLNHKLRGRASDADERLVHQVTRKLHLRLVSEHADVRALSHERQISIEMAARALRHDFLARTAGRLKISTIAIAHHADDQLELFFLRLLRGSGGEGLNGMKWRNASPANPKIELVRPLLGVSKAEVKTFARQHRVPFHEDQTNADLDIQRNRIRHELLPLLRRKYQPALGTTIARVMEITGGESEFVSDSANDWLTGSGKKIFSNLPVAVQRQVLRAQLIEQGIDPEFDLVERLRSASKKEITLSSTLQVWRNDAGQVRLEARARSAANRPAMKAEGGSCRIDIRRPARSVFNGTIVRWGIEPQKAFRLPKTVAGCEVFDADKVGAEILLRHWRAGDRFQPIGMTSPVKLQDLFVNAKIPRERRGRLVVATTASGEIFWVEGLRISERFKLTPATVRRLKWAWGMR